MRFEVRPGDQPSFDSASVERSEVLKSDEIKFGQTYTLSYKFMIEPGQALNADWMILGQVHHRNDEGESGGSPPFAIELNDGVMRVISRTSDEKIRTSNAPSKTLWKDDAQIERGHWYDVKAEIKFDPFGNGAVNMWLDGQQIINYKGAIGYNDDEGGYLKMGIYRRASSETVAVNYDNMQMVEGKTAAMPSQGSVNETLEAALGGNAIDVSQYDANKYASRDQAFVFIGDEEFTKVGQLRFYHDREDEVTVIEGNTDADLRPEFHLKYQGLITPQGSDFIL
jgi:hypothetical protein